MVDIRSDRHRVERSCTHPAVVFHLGRDSRPREVVGSVVLRQRVFEHSIALSCDAKFGLTLNGVIGHHFLMNGPWIATDQAAEYLAIGRTKLYELTREGRIPAKHLGKKWMYDREALARWMQASRRLEDFFQDTPANIEANPELREPQRDAYLQAAAYFQRGGQKALIQIPVGCGKSGVAATLPFGIARGQVLVIAPNLTIKEELYPNGCRLPRAGGIGPVRLLSMSASHLRGSRLPSRDATFSLRPMADLSTQSGKAHTARRYGIPLIAVADFLEQIRADTTAAPGFATVRDRPHNVTGSVITSVTKALFN